MNAWDLSRSDLVHSWTMVVFGSDWRPAEIVLGDRTLDSWLNELWGPDGLLVAAGLVVAVRSRLARWDRSSSLDFLAARDPELVEAVLAAEVHGT